MKLIVLLVILLFQINIFANEAILLNEADIVSYVKKHNDLVNAEKFEVQSLEYETDSLDRSFIPKVSIGAAQERFKYVANEFIDQPY